MFSEIYWVASGIEGRYEIKASEVIKKVGTLSEEQIQNICKSPVVDPKSSNRVRQVASIFRTKSIQRCLSELGQLARWAVSHNYDTLVAA